MRKWQFIGRARELSELESQYRAAESNFVPIYGRRRVGKSELILHFKGERPGIYFVGKQAPTALQLQEFLLGAAHALGEPLLAKTRVIDWRTALSDCFDLGKGRVS